MGVSAISKTLLSAYKDLEEQCKIIDGLMVSFAVRSSNRDLYKSIDKLFAYQNEKIALINAKVIVDEILDKMGYSVALKSVYIEKNAKPNETSEKQLEKFNALLLEAYEPIKLFDMISDSKFIMKIYRHFSRQEQGVKREQGKK